MAVIGMLGGILFQVSDRQVLNFSKLQRSVSGKERRCLYFWGRSSRK